MKYNLKNREECDAAFTYLTELVAKEAIAEVKKIPPRRSLNQNRYLHLLLGYFGSHFGYTLDEAKLIYKQVNHQTYRYFKNDRQFYKSSRDLTTEEMTKTIDRFRQASEEQGLPLPTATDQEWLRQVENQIEREGYYL